ncbi:AAA family ATPase [Sporomusa acidovorans]|uniref:AAA+ ATPase domain-containing protein n=1 Tax=Sporomusa acidovorans (strain ATCC 49682 / DSM 3132 / Mol) TaxID=1123286 RepID=A0ABZ3J3X7_SPOA4|nr:MoxR family ATPase [Sporomusa acidovorans]OZC15477.1 holliday junction ATP-dependent DNA helicase RuvB [Sporomusa acidovorans DSM 3132]SDE15719.1 MoxR-like ATPase [Sporomusa acidovorans]
MDNQLKNLSAPELKAAFEAYGYISDKELLTTIYLALKLEKPLLIEGAPGVGKTEIAKVLSKVFDTELIRLQCYEGLDENKALYEWNYQRQLIKIQMSRDNTSGEAISEQDIFSPEYLLERPLLKAIRAEKRAVLLIDEIDKTDEEFEAFLFEILSDFQISIPELSTISAKHIPIVVLTSNHDRELSEGLRRRCVYLYIDYPSIEKEINIIRTKIPEATEKLALQIATAVNHLRNNLTLSKQPSIAETLDWTRSLLAMHADHLDPALVRQTMGLLFKNRDDLLAFQKDLGPDGLCSAVNQTTGPKPPIFHCHSNASCEG